MDYDKETQKFHPIPDQELFEMLKNGNRPLFQVGDVFVVKGIPMRLRKITKKDLVLRPIKKSKEAKNGRKNKRGKG